MKSGWFWGTPMWEEYRRHYWSWTTRPEEYKSSPLADDDDLIEGYRSASWTMEQHQTQVIDLANLTWRDVRKSYHSLIHRAAEDFAIEEMLPGAMLTYQSLHGAANGGAVRPDQTFEIQEQWLKDGYGLLIGAHNYKTVGFAAFAYWITYQNCAYYASGPSVQPNVQHAVLWHSLVLLKARGFRLAELGQIDGATEKEKNIGIFKQGFGGKAMPFTIVRRTLCEPYK